MNPYIHTPEDDRGMVDPPKVKTCQCKKKGCKCKNSVQHGSVCIYCLNRMHNIDEDTGHEF